MPSLVVVVGAGEVGNPLCRILGRVYSCQTVDIEPVEISQPCSVLHICYPFQITDFVGETVRYMQKYQPDLTIINSTVSPGTTRNVFELSGRRAVAYSPVRGKHARMEQDMMRYTKFVAGCDPEATESALQHLSHAGFKVEKVLRPEAAEVSKLLETSYLGVLVGWAQDMERIAERYDTSFREVQAFFEEIDFLPSHIFPGLIGGHCVMPNIAILKEQVHSDFLDAVVASNEAKRMMLEMATKKAVS